MAFLKCSIRYPFVWLCPEWGEPKPSFLECALSALSGEVWEESYGLSHCLVKDAVYSRELAFNKDVEVGRVVFRFK